MHENIGEPLQPADDSSPSSEEKLPGATSDRRLEGVNASSFLPRPAVCKCPNFHIRLPSANKKTCFVTKTEQGF
jgi:hypothetical protein